MLCILAFIVFLILFPILGFFPEYRVYFKRSWECVFKKITLKPCDINLGEELKNKFIGSIFKLSPKFASFLDKTFTFWAFLFVIINIWSLGYVGIAGLNLWVHDTCTPDNASACSLSSDTCSIPSTNLSFDEALKAGKLGNWISQPFVDFGETFVRIPDRLKNWNADDYLPEKPTFYHFDKNNKTAVEMIDPSCQFCQKLFKSTKESKFYEKHNLTYIVYPIPDKNKPNGYRFDHSYLIATYLESLKDLENTTQSTPNNSQNSQNSTNLTPNSTPNSTQDSLQNSTNSSVNIEQKTEQNKAGNSQENKEKNNQVPLDWQFLEIIFAGRFEDKYDYQYLFNVALQNKPVEAEQEIIKILGQMGLSPEQIKTVQENTKSENVKKRLEKNKDIVENQVKTVKIPTIIFGGRRFDKYLDTDFLKNN